MLCSFAADGFQIVWLNKREILALGNLLQLIPNGSKSLVFRFVQCFGFCPKLLDGFWLAAFFEGLLKLIFQHLFSCNPTGENRDFREV